MKLDKKRTVFIGTYLVLFQIAFIVLMGLFGGYHYEEFTNKSYQSEEVPKLYASKF